MTEPRQLFVIRQSAYEAVLAGSVTKAERLVDEAYERGRSEQRQENRKALGTAWSAFLETVPADFWLWLRYDNPELHRQLLSFLERK